ncbi:MAG TPA: RNA 2',3'-cyclic phosphodiesterase [Thermomicrobiaceae bacterium]|nr:RNA 2',3'-cyclic phosphodiesterase [Thermomicrobiaceae bacterium]
MDPSEAGQPPVWRLFVAIELPDAVHRRVAEVVSRLAGVGWRAKWVNPAGVHVTLKFYGNVAVGRLDELGAALSAAVAGRAPFALRVDGPGVFPSPRRPRVIWLGLEGELDALSSLARDVERVSAPLGFAPEERPFRPHITVARVRPEQQATISGLEDQFARLAALPPIPFRVDHLTLMRSQLRRDGPIYTAVRRIELDVRA